MRAFALLALALAAGATVAVAQDAPGAITNSWESVVDLISNKDDTTEIWQAVQEADLADALDELTNITATVFIPWDEVFNAEDAANLTTTELVDILKYHVVPGQAFTLDELTDGQILQTLVEGPAGQLRVFVSPNSIAQKPFLQTSSGQQIQIYQFNLGAGVDTVVHTIRGLLVPGDESFDAAAPAAV